MIFVDDVYIIEAAGRTLTWRDTFIWKNPFDLFVYQEIAREVRPTLVIETGTNMGGSALFWADMLELHGGGRVVTVDKEDRQLGPHPRITYLVGLSTHPDTFKSVRRRVKKSDRVLVNLDSNHSYRHVLDEMELYGPLVSEGSYLIVEDAIDEVLFERLEGKGVLTATREFLAGHPEFERDEACERYELTNCPEGFLLRV